MTLPGQADTARKQIVRLAHAGLDSAALRGAVGARLRRVVPAEAYGFAMLDPATMLLTGSVRENIPDATVALLAANEYGRTTTSSSPTWPAGRCRPVGSARRPAGT